MGGYYFDWLEKKWLPRQHRELSQQQQRQRSRRVQLLRDLLAEIGSGDSVSQLYAALLARTLVGQDEELMRQYGQQVAGLMHDHHVTA